MIVAGTITVDPTSGNVTFDPDDSTNASKSLYNRLVAENLTSTQMVKSPSGKATLSSDGKSITPGTPSSTSKQVINITPTPEINQKNANYAMLFAGWFVDDIMPELIVNLTIGKDTISASLPAADVDYTGTVD